METVKLVTISQQAGLVADDQSIYSQILNDIAQGQLVSGDRLVTTQLAKKYGSSINPVREALKQLEGEGFVAFQKNSGARVARFAFSTMRDVFEMLQLLEPYLLKEFTQNHTPEDIAELENIIQKMTATQAQDFTRFRELDTAFHWQLYRGHYNQEAVKLWRRKRLILQAMHANLPISHKRYSDAVAEHQTLLSFISKGAVEEANEALLAHIKSGGDYWIAQVTETASSSGYRPLQGLTG
ncbi:GntR family transcriptional regulator [Thalassotalea litorea]|uniref:GntR family transcriptional regulator n=1 Tax=Thalassotalea litorea TaxID=2020715 RepID=A0A5R9ISV4_9GAMM|nr:GntR family transcriptional regulator [Thalassotalea litorea]TLU66391.1 GntR family transcriptional regulator [Thalassotalea litorea]